MVDFCDVHGEFFIRYGGVSLCPCCFFEGQCRVFGGSHSNNSA